MKRVWLFSTLSETLRQTNLSLALRMQRAGQEPRLGQDLEAVADAEHGTPSFARLDHSRMIGEWAAIAPQRR